MTTDGEKVTLLAEIIRMAIRGTTVEYISEELTLSQEQASAYLRFLKSKGLIVLVDGRDYFPTAPGLAYLATYDEASELMDLDGPQPSRSGTGAQSLRGVSWSKTELAARMREIIDP